MKKINLLKYSKKDLLEIQAKFKTTLDQKERIKTILFNNDIEYFRPYYSLFTNLKEIDFVKDFYEIYKMDIQIRKLLFSHWNRLEIAIKSRLATFLTQRYGSYSFNKDFFDKAKNKSYLQAEKMMNHRIESELKIKYFNGKFYWDDKNEALITNGVVLKYATFSNVAFFVNALKQEDLELFVKNYFTIKNPKTVVTWLKEAANFRNHISHLGKIVQENNYLNLGEEINQKLNHSLFFKALFLYKEFLGDKIYQTFLSEFQLLLKEKVKNEKYMYFYGYDLKNKNIMELLNV